MFTLNCGHAFTMHRLSLEILATAGLVQLQPASGMPVLTSIRVLCWECEIR